MGLPYYDPEGLAIRANTAPMRFDAASYWNERHDRTSGLHGVGYLGLGGLNEWMYRVRKRVFRRVVKSTGVDVKGARILDVGTGTGFYLDRWRELGATDVTGADFSLTACERLRAEYPGTTIENLDIGTQDAATIEQLGKFDLISVMDVFYHLVDDAVYRRAFGNLERLLKPGGKLIFTENFLQSTRRTGNDWHVSRTLTEIEEHTQRSQLHLQSRRPWFIALNDPVDSAIPAHHRAWWVIRKLSEKIPGAGWAIGASLYPAEVLLTKVLKESPTTEIAVAQRISDRRE